MTKISIPFNTWSKERLNNRTKTATSRTKKYGKVGNTFIVNKTRYKLDLIVKLPLWFIAKCLYSTEGCDNSSEFEMIWCEIHPIKKWVRDQEVWYHHFFEMEK